jgi:hypothetical protein
MLQTSRRRLPPIVMTALATVAGILPLAFAQGCRLTAAAAVGHCSDRRNPDRDGAIADHYARRSLLPK